ERKQAEIQNVDQEKDDGINGKVDLQDSKLPTERAEHCQETGKDARNSDSVKQAGKAARNQFGDGKRRGGRMNAVGFHYRKIKLGLGDMYFDALSGPDARYGAGSNGGGNDARGVFITKRKGRLGLRRNSFVAARTIDFQATSNFTPPLRFLSRGGRNRRLGWIVGGFAKWAHLNALIADCATLRADLNHPVRFALRTVIRGLKHRNRFRNR
ncbi:MAG: hypothetical protein WAN10_15410, partial [Candidatus Acidiferrales bacterium]